MAAQSVDDDCRVRYRPREEYDERNATMIARAAAALLASLLAASARGEVIRFDAQQTVPAFEGRVFGDVGPYVRITGRATIAIDPGDPRNAVIADIDRAPRNSNGMVEAIADVVVLRPVDPSRGNGTLLVDVPNRGRKLAPQLFDDVGQPGANNAEKSADAGPCHSCDRCADGGDHATIIRLRRCGAL